MNKLITNTLFLCLTVNINSLCTLFVAYFTTAYYYTYIPLSRTNKMKRYTVFFIAVDAVHVSGGFSAHHQELKLYTQQ